MYLNMLSSNGAFLPIDKHTRVIGKFRSTCIIDRVSTNDISNIIFPCVFLSDTSDHFPIAIIVERKNKKQDIIRGNKQLYFFRNLKKLIMIALLIICNRHSLSFNTSNMKLKNHFQILLNS